MERYDYFKIRYQTDMFHHGYVNLEDFSEGVARVYHERKGVSYIDKSGKLIMPYRKDIQVAGSFKNGVAACMVYKLWLGHYRECVQIITKTGEIVFTKRVNGIGSFDDDFILICQDTGWGCIDRKGNDIIPCIYEALNGFSNGLFCAKKDGKWGYLDAKGNIAIPFVYDRALNFSDENAIVEQNGKRFYINKQGKKLLPFPYELYKFTKHLRGINVVQKGDYQGAIKLGKEIIPCIYDNIILRKEGFSVEKDKKWGWLDQNGNEIIPCIYDASIEYGDNLFCVKKEGKYGYIDEKGKEMIPFMYQNAYPFCDGYAHVVNAHGGGFISKNNEPLIVEAEDYISSPSEIPKDAFNIKIEEYLSAFVIDGQTVFVRDTDYEKYRQKLQTFLSLIEKDGKEYMEMMFAEICDRGKTLKKE